MNVNFEALGQRHCRFIVRMEPEKLYCGDPKITGSSFCSHHHAMCWVSLPKRGAVKQPTFLPREK